VEFLFSFGGGAHVKIVFILESQTLLREGGLYSRCLAFSSKELILLIG
jgi:hypothetical protein